MTLTAVLLLLNIFSLSVLARNSPHGEEFLNEYAQTIYSSNNVNEDTILDVPGLIHKYGYPVEVHHVTTRDGYILELHRIPHGRARYNVPGVHKTVAFLQHGLESASSDFVIMGPGHGLAYILAEEGYDVWMGNARGNYYSRRHVNLNPKRPMFWDFSWHEIGTMDLRAMIDYVLQHTEQKRLHYIGFSQGTTVLWVLASEYPEYNERFISVQALAPIAFVSNVKSPLLRKLAKYTNVLGVITSMLGVNELTINKNVMQLVGLELCPDESRVQYICSNILFLFTGYDTEQLNSTMLPVIMGHTPAGASTKQVIHYGQLVQSGKFRYFDLGFIFNLKKYQSLTPPSYNLDRIVAPVFLHYSDGDWLAVVDDVSKLSRHLPNSTMIRVSVEKFRHHDFVWAMDVKHLLYDRVISIMRQLS